MIDLKDKSSFSKIKSISVAEFEPRINNVKVHVFEITASDLDKCYHIISKIIAIIIEIHKIPIRPDFKEILIKAILTLMGQKDQMWN